MYYVRDLTAIRMNSNLIFLFNILILYFLINLIFHSKTNPYTQIYVNVRMDQFVTTIRIYIFFFFNYCKDCVPPLTSETNDYIVTNFSRSVASSHKPHFSRSVTSSHKPHICFIMIFNTRVGMT